MKEQITWNLSGAEIEAESFHQIEREAGALKEKFLPQEWRVARRLIHTTADFSIAEDLEFKNNPISAGINALRNHAPIYCDSNMIRSGLSVPKLQNWNPQYQRESIHCFISDPDVIATANRRNTTRALAAIRKARPLLDGGIFLCGNAPLALAGTIEMVLEEGLRPALIIGMPVGFVNVTESKEWLNQIDIPWVRIQGRRGGSPLAVATLHALMENTP